MADHRIPTYRNSDGAYVVCIYTFASAVGTMTPDPPQQTLFVVLLCGMSYGCIPGQGFVLQELRTSSEYFLLHVSNRYPTRGKSVEDRASFTAATQKYRHLPCYEQKGDIRWSLPRCRLPVGRTPATVRRMFWQKCVAIIFEVILSLGRGKNFLGNLRMFVELTLTLTRGQREC